MTETGEEWRRIRRDVVCIGGRGVIRRESERIVRIERHRQLLSEIVVRDRKTAANDGLPVGAKQLSQPAVLEVRRPSYGYARLPIVLIPFVEIRAAVLGSDAIDRQQLGIVLAKLSSGYTPSEVFVERDIRRSLKSLGLINRTAKSGL